MQPSVLTPRCIYVCTHACMHICLNACMHAYRHVKRYAAQCFDSRMTACMRMHIDIWSAMQHAHVSRKMYVHVCLCIMKRCCLTREIYKHTHTNTHIWSWSWTICQDWNEWVALLDKWFQKEDWFPLESFGRKWSQLYTILLVSRFLFQDEFRQGSSPRTREARFRYRLFQDALEKEFFWALVQQVVVFD